MIDKEDDYHESDEAPCECDDKVKPGQAYHCPVCDADWFDEEDDQ